MRSKGIRLIMSGVCIYACGQKKLNSYFLASLPRETWTKDSPLTLDATLSLTRAIGASCT